ncbi:ABC transporter ATP-binding protein [Pradoshia sp. D12]|uniref:ABC transporter ATP-binding protein n=1 Tax=Bacillaceae TaxID=186817 RepID=UPI00112B24C9|nr:MULTISPECIES: ABC transporter ATP-binding protein [Bacillaceae]QFK72031.1 ABC transporter ATP-binding protein [Pradoshia sp. D12]TPF71477.1 ABC transporter ATP-binding protein [Bacillus sp. D12]
MNEHLEQTESGWKTGKRLYQYAVKCKGTIILALMMLSISVGADLIGPYIGKNMIDNHIMGIESPWVETKDTKDAVHYQGSTYKREAYVEDGEWTGSEVAIQQVGTTFLFLNQPIEFDGKRSYKDGQLVITSGEKRATYEAQKLSGAQIMAFYQPEISRIMQLLALYFGIMVVAFFFQYGQSYYLQKAANRIIQTMRKDVFAQIQRLPIRYFDNLPAGKVVARITNDTEAIRELYVRVLANFFSSTVNIIGIIIALFLLNVKLGMVTLIILPLLVGWTLLFRKFATKYNRVIRARISDINAMINESINGMNIIQAFKREKETTEEFEKLNTEHYVYQSKMQKLNSLLNGNLVGALRVITLTLFIWYFGGMAASGESVVSLGVLYAMVNYLNRLFHPISGIVNQFANFEQAMVAGERVFALLEEEGIDVEDQRKSRFKGHVEFDHVSFSYKEGEKVLRDIQFEASQGETIALVGHTGSGKSSIMNLLFRFYDYQEGAIRIDGIELKDIPHQTLREHMGIVLQDPYLFTGTILSNITLDDPKISREVAEKALRDVGADRVLAHLEHGFDEPVVEKGSTLSSGQRQLISFARALAFNPAILILDEATSSIDTETESLIQEAMEVLKKGRTTFIIAHRLSTIKSADQILVLDKGKIVERGNHDELMELKGKYYQMYELQIGKLAG